MNCDYKDGHSIDGMVDEMSHGELYDLFAEYHNNMNNDDFYGYDYVALGSREGEDAYIELWKETDVYKSQFE